jgi:hypothetical protein
MKKGKAPALIVLAVEIVTIAVLHAVKINQSEKIANKDMGKTISVMQPESRARDAGFSLAVYK